MRHEGVEYRENGGVSDRMFHAVGAGLFLIIAGAVAWGFEWAVMLLWTFVEALRNV